MSVVYQIGFGKISESFDGREFIEPVYVVFVCESVASDDKIKKGVSDEKSGLPKLFTITSFFL